MRSSYEAKVDGMRETVAALKLQLSPAPPAEAVAAEQIAELQARVERLWAAQLLAARATLAFAATLDADLDSVDRDRAAFERAFRADVALLLRVQTASVFIAGVTGGSVVVSCEVAGVVDTGASQLKGQVVANYTVAAVSTTGTDTARLISDDCAEGHTGNLIYILSNRRGWKF